MRASRIIAQRGKRGNESLRAFTVIELLVVIAIIGVLTAVGLPAIKGLNQSQTANNASQQLIDDLALARQYAINNRSLVHVLFVPPSIQTMAFSPTHDLPKRLMTGVYTTYAIFAERTVGDQPGQPRPRYLGKWKSLPDGMFIATNEFRNMAFKPWEQIIEPLNRPFLSAHPYGFPFPTLTNNVVMVPHITFDSQGRLVFVNPENGARYPRDEVIELARGSILASRDANGDLLYFDVRESPPGNHIDNFNRIRLDGLTGRATLERPEL